MPIDESSMYRIAREHGIAEDDAHFMAEFWDWMKRTEEFLGELKREK